MRTKCLSVKRELYSPVITDVGVGARSQYLCPVLPQPTHLCELIFVVHFDFISESHSFVSSVENSAPQCGHTPCRHTQVSWQSGVKNRLQNLVGLMQYLELYENK